MERVLDNLVNNALRYCEQRLRIGLWFNGHLACLQVEDDGPAFPADKRQRVLAPFVRLDPSHDRATGGCGLGLAIIHSIAVAYQGKCLSRAAPWRGPLPLLLAIEAYETAQYPTLNKSTSFWRT